MKKLITICAVTAVLALLCMGGIAQGGITEYSWDSNTLVLDHFDGSTSGTSYGSLEYTDGVLGQAAMFNNNNFVKYPSAWSGDAGTIEMWVRLRQWNTQLLNLNWYDTSSNPPGGHVGQLRVVNDGKLLFWAGEWSGEDTIISNSSVPLNTWTHVAVTWGTGTKLYINGVLDWEKTANLQPAGPQWAYLLYWGQNAGPDIDELRISDVARPVPEPATMALLGLGGLGLLRRKRSKA